MTQKTAPPCFKAPYGKPDVAAIQALEKGDASPEQQKRALQWVIECGAMTYQDVYSRDSEQDTAFMNGRRFVGLRVIKLLKLNLRAFKENKDE